MFSSLSNFSKTSIFSLKTRAYVSVCLTFWFHYWMKNGSGEGTVGECRTTGYAGLARLYKLVISFSMLTGKTCKVRMVCCVLRYLPAVTVSQSSHICMA